MAILENIDIYMGKLQASNIHEVILENIDRDIDIDKENLENIGIDIDMDREILENIDIHIYMEIMRNIDKILYRLEFGISNRSMCTCNFAFKYFG